MLARHHSDARRPTLFAFDFYDHVLFTSGKHPAIAHQLAACLDVALRWLRAEGLVSISKLIVFMYRCYRWPRWIVSLCVPRLPFPVCPSRRHDTVIIVAWEHHLSQWHYAILANNFET